MPLTNSLEIWFQRGWLCGTRALGACDRSTYLCWFLLSKSHSMVRRWVNILVLCQSGSRSDLCPHHRSCLCHCMLGSPQREYVYSHHRPDPRHMASQWRARGRYPVGNAYYWITWKHKSLGYWNGIAILNINLISLYSRNNVISMKKSKNKQWNLFFWIRSKPNKNTDHNRIIPAMASFQYPFGSFGVW